MGAAQIDPRAQLLFLTTGSKVADIGHVNVRRSRVCFRDAEKTLGEY